MFQGPSRSRWRMRGLRIPSFVRSRSSDSRETHRGDDEPDRHAAAADCDDLEDRLCEERSSKTLGSRISFWKRKSANITEYDPTYRVVYLGNVLTGWAKGRNFLATGFCGKKCHYFKQFTFLHLH